LFRLAKIEERPSPLVDVETRLWRAFYSKDYYEPVTREVLSLIPKNARSVLSIGCGWGATEARLVEMGLRVVAIPLDPVICGRALDKGVQVVAGDLNTSLEQLKSERFDCFLYLNILHLTRDPIAILSAFSELASEEAKVIIQSPNMLSIPDRWMHIRDGRPFRNLGNYGETGVHLTTVRKIQNWCRHSGLRVDATVAILHKRGQLVRRLAPGFIKLFCMAPEFVVAASRPKLN
jgi:2-polyprenyl-3-methyl-5-hydroxy-6-metoxy-1,4-benzoquinol methylase